MVERERDGHLDQRHSVVLGQVGEGFGRLQLSLVDRQGHVETVGEALPGRGRGGQVGVLAPAAREPATRERTVGDHSHAVPGRGGQDVGLDASHEHGVRGLFAHEPLQAPVVGGPLGLDDLAAGEGGGTEVADLALAYQVRQGAQGLFDVRVG